MAKTFRAIGPAIIAATIATLAATPSANADPVREQVTFSGTANEDRGNAGVSYLRALGADLSSDAAILRLNLRGGTADGEVDNSTADVLFGYQLVRDGWKYRLFGGVEARTSDGETTFGPKAMGQIQSRKSIPLYVNATFSLSDDRYQTNLQVGHRFESVVLGPEIGLSGVDGSETLRFGLVATDLRLGEVGLTLRGGVLVDREDDTRNIPYVGASATYQF